MARLRKGCAYRNLERPYTRKSKYKKLSFVRATPASKVVRYESGNMKKAFSDKVILVSKESLQIRHNAIESARLSANRHLEKMLGKQGFCLKIRIFPHHVLRENPLASGAGADRMSTGMKKSFGKAIGVAAQVRSGQVLFEALVDNEGVETARKALKRASYKLPCSCSVAAN
jgi:large subunit ribosomal protein L10e